MVPVGPATPTLFISTSIFFVFFLILSKKFSKSYSSEASHSWINNLLLFNGCFFILFILFVLISQRYTFAPLDKNIFAVTQPIPDAPAEIITFLF